MTTQQAFSNFIYKCEVKNLTKKSIVSYRTKIVPFMNFLSEQGIELSDVNKSTVDAFVVWARENTTANDITINSYLRTVRAFLYFCMESNYMSSFRMSLTKAEKKMKETYTKQELAILLKKPSNTDSFNEYKVWVFENFMLGTGMRLETALNIKISDINFETKLIFLSTVKNRKQQFIPLSSKLAVMLKEYITKRNTTEDDVLFCNHYGKPASERSYQQYVQKYNNDRGVDLTSIHAFRHTFAREFILNGGDTFRLQKIMGHSDISVTKEYVDLFGQDLIIGFDDFNPLDNL